MLLERFYLYSWLIKKYLKNYPNNRAYIFVANTADELEEI